MPEMKGTEFLSKTLPQFPNTVRIILTGFTDIEDLVDAINSGQVYKYITKPWDPNELKAVVEKAAETYELLNQRTEELYRAQLQTQLLTAVMDSAQESENLEAALETVATAFSDSYLADVCILQLLEGDALASVQGTHTTEARADNWLADDPLVKEAIASKTMQATVNVSKDKNLSGVEHYQASGIESHIAVPIIYRDEPIALLSLQWKQPCQLRPDELTTIHLCSQQVALVLTCLKK
jgi:YesN/AraC family two-component response regulator